VSCDGEPSGAGRDEGLEGVGEPLRRSGRCDRLRHFDDGAARGNVSRSQVEHYHRGPEVRSRGPVAYGHLGAYTSVLGAPHGGSEGNTMGACRQPPRGPYTGS
jgi:hypothetical protein